MTVERSVIIPNKNGLHARPAAAIVKLASRFNSRITLSRDGMEVNGRSIMGVMMLAAECGSTIVIRADGTDAPELVSALEELIGSGFGEN